MSSKIFVMPRQGDLVRRERQLKRSTATIPQAPTSIVVVKDPPPKEAEQKKPVPSRLRPPFPWVMVTGLENEYATIARKNSIAEVNAAVQLWAQELKKYKKRHFARSMQASIGPVTFMGDSPLRGQVMEGFFILGVSEFVLDETWFLLQLLAKAMSSRLGRQIVEIRVNEPRVLTRNDAPLAYQLVSKKG